MTIKDLKEPVLMLAPMEGITNRYFRDSVCDLNGVDVVATEFIRITGPKQKVKPLPSHSVPLQIQFMASSAEDIKDCIRFLKNKEILTEKSWIDLNVGCPSKRVNAHGAGAALLCEPKKLFDMICKIREVHSGTFSVKTRIGYQNEEDYPKIISMLSKCPIDFISIHARTKVQGYNAPVNLTRLAEAVNRLPYPVIGNGDIWNVEDAMTMLRETGVAGLMCGRGAVSNPFLFSEIKAEIYNQQEVKKTRIDLIKFVIKLFKKYKVIEKQTKKRYIGCAKELCVWLSKNPLIGKEFFQSIKRINSLEEIIVFLEKEIK